MRHIFGAIGKDGSSSISGSEDWESKKVEEGVYEIAFKSAFTSEPVVVASGYIPRVEGGAASDNTFVVGPIATDRFTVRSFDVTSKEQDNAGKAQDAPFTFIALGKE